MEQRQPHQQSLSLPLLYSPFSSIFYLTIHRTSSDIPFCEAVGKGHNPCFLLPLLHYECSHDFGVHCWTFSSKSFLSFCYLILIQDQLRYQKTHTQYWNAWIWIWILVPHFRFLWVKTLAGSRCWVNYSRSDHICENAGLNSQLLANWPSPVHWWAVGDWTSR